MEEKKKVIVGVVIVIAVIVIAVGVYYFLLREKPKEAVPAPVAAPAPVQPRVEEPVVKEKAPETIEVELNKSDELLRELTKGLSLSATFPSWMMTKNLIRKFVAATDNIAQGMSPRSQVTFFSPKGRFKVVQKEDVFYVDSADYARYNPAVEVFLSLDSKGCVDLYRKLKAPIQEAYKELGYPNRDFNKTLTLAIIELLKVPVVRGEIRLEERVISYGLSDPKLEALSDAQKHLLRMGPENVLKVQLKLREIATELGISANRIPRSRIYQAQ